MKFELFYPYRPFQVSQNFGENKACCFPNLSGVVSENPDGTCPAGKVKLYPLLGMKGHTGQDLYAPMGAILRSPLDGVVEEVQTEIERGLGVGIVSNDKRDMGEYGSHYAKVRQWHLKVILVVKGQKVNCGDPIGLADSTGLSSASHNHFELKPVEYINGVLVNVYQTNGYYGSIDPAPYWNGVYAADYRSITQDIPAMLMKLALGIQNYLKGRQK